MKKRAAKPKVKDECKTDKAKAGPKEDGGIRSTAIAATPGDGTSQGRRRMVHAFG